jgi:hypothetical protein
VCGCRCNYVVRFSENAHKVALHHKQTCGDCKSAKLFTVDFHKGSTPLQDGQTLLEEVCLWYVSVSVCVIYTRTSDAWTDNVCVYVFVLSVQVQPTHPRHHGGGVRQLEEEASVRTPRPGTG